MSRKQAELPATQQDLVEEVLAYEAGCDALQAALGCDAPLNLSLNQINSLGRYVLRERVRKYREGSADALRELERTKVVDKRP